MQVFCQKFKKKYHLCPKKAIPLDFYREGLAVYDVC